MTDKPLISVLMPAYNCASTIGSAIASILEQDYPETEVVVVDDGSVDGTAEVVRSIRDDRIRLVPLSRNGGIVAALNAGLRECTGSYIARQDADDIAMPTRLSRQSDVLRENPAIGAVGSALQTVDAKGRKGAIWHYPATAAHSRWQCLFKTPVAHSAVMVRKSIMDVLGGYLPDFPHAEDFELWSRMLDHCDIVSLQSPLLLYSLGEGGISRSRREAQERTHIRVSAANMGRLARRSVPEPECELLSLRLDQGRFPVDREVVLRSAALCSELFTAFTHGATAHVDRAVRNDYEGRMIGLVRLAPWRSRGAWYRAIARLDRAGMGGLPGLAKALRP